MRRFIAWLNDKFNGQAGDWMDSSSGEKRAFTARTNGMAYNPDTELEELARAKVESPVSAFHEDLRRGKVKVASAYVFEGKFNVDGKLLVEDGKPAFRTRRLEGHSAYKDVLMESERQFKKVALRESKKAKESFNSDQVVTSYDPLQYTEYTPTYGGPFNKQLYLYDYLTMHARVFEERNHNPVAKRIIDVLSQYSFGRRFKVKILNPKKQKAWEEFAEKYNIIHRCSEFWIREYLLYGELMINKKTWQSIDPSTVWDIITDPDDITNVYYYYQSYPTAFQTFTGYKVSGAPGSKDVKPLEYVIRQIPFTQVIHIKGNVVSQEKRGRSILYPVIGWLKRLKDLYNAEVLKQQLEACFIWDDTINGSDSDVQAHISKFSSLPLPASVFAHNEQVVRKPMAALQTGGRSGMGVGDELLALIATGIGLPKDFLNIIGGSGGGSRATALVGAEPFEKLVEDIQAKFENLLLNIAQQVLEEAGLDYEHGDVEFIFPSVTKDTTTESIKNIQVGETMGYISHETAADMYAGEMNITTYDYDIEQKKVADNPAPVMPPAGRFGDDSAGDDDDSGEDGGAMDGVVHKTETPIHGTGKAKLKQQLKNV